MFKYNIDYKRFYRILQCESSESRWWDGAKLAKMYNTKMAVVSLDEENILQNYFDFSPNNTV